MHQKLWLKIHQIWYSQWQSFHENGEMAILIARLIWHAWSFMPYSSSLPYGHNLRKCKHIIISRKGFGSVPTPAKFWLAFGSAPLGVSVHNPWSGMKCRGQFKGIMESNKTFCVGFFYIFIPGMLSSYCLIDQVWNAMGILRAYWW